MIEYEYTEGARYVPVRVRLDGRIVGIIRPVREGTNDQYSWQYFPKGQKRGGEIFPTLAAWQRNLGLEKQR
jgi:hypothetical protein